MNEAEELLSDICKCYSEDQWTQLSTRAYSLLADCQRNLNLEEKWVRLMALKDFLFPLPVLSQARWYHATVGFLSTLPSGVA